MKKQVLLLTSLAFLFLTIGCFKSDEFSRDFDEATLDASAFSNSKAGSGSAGGVGSGVYVPPGQITAGEWRDTENWDYWAELMGNDEWAEFKTSWNFKPAERFSVEVFGESAQPVMDAEVLLKDISGLVIWKARTDNKGKAELWANLFEEGQTAARIEIQYNGQAALVYSPKPFEKATNVVQLNVSDNLTPNADVAFIVDATGSMGDEITYLKSELLDVIQRIQNSSFGVNLRTSAVFYRDEGDEYVTKKSDFSSSGTETVNFVKQQNAGGGGNFPEAVDQALQVAVEELEWSSSARARIAFLILDVPPHENSMVIENLQNQIRQAAEKGIKLIPITASGINKSTEFLMRFIELATNGTYVFITDHSGIGNSHLEPTVGEYEVEFLNELMVRLVKEYLE